MGLGPPGGGGAVGGAGVAVAAAADSREDIEVEEVHAAEDQQDHSHFVAEKFDGGTGGVNDLRGFEGEGDEPDVDQVEADDQQMIDGVGQFAVAMECVDQENGSALVES